MKIENKIERRAELSEDLLRLLSDDIEALYIIDENGDERFSEEAQDKFNQIQDMLEGAGL
tara:strand:+ start:1231 stop:1410 length:180 start_codon:yes stop_codon:yes gene_type:complete